MADLTFCREYGKKIDVNDPKCPNCGALFRCIACGNDVSAKDCKCPHCGEKLKETITFWQIVIEALKAVFS